MNCAGYTDGLHCDHWFSDVRKCCQCGHENVGDEPRDDWGDVPSVAWCEP